MTLPTAVHLDRRAWHRPATVRVMSRAPPMTPGCLTWWSPSRRPPLTACVPQAR